MKTKRPIRAKCPTAKSALGTKCIPSGRFVWCNTAAMAVFIAWIYFNPGNVDPTSIAESANVSIIRNQSDSAVTNSSYYTPYDMEIKDELNDAFHKLNKSNDITYSVKTFSNLKKTNPLSVQAHYGLALSINRLAHLKLSNALLQQSIKALAEALLCPNIPDSVYVEIATFRAERLQFLGRFSDVLAQWKSLSNKFPANINILNGLGTAYCLNEASHTAKIKAKETFNKVLLLDPSNEYALAHLGFVMAVYERDPHTAAPLFAKALSGSNEEILQSAKFYIHAGDSFYRTGQTEMAAKIFKQGATKKVFLSERQRSSFNVDRLTGRPWWKLMQLPTHYQQHFNRLKEKWKEILKEGLDLIDSKTGLFMSESENLRATGQWKQFTLFSQGREHKAACEKAPKTCGLILPFIEASRNKRGQVKFSLLFPGTKVWPHTGPTNCRLRAHLGLQVPQGAGIKVAGETRVWKEGDLIVLDDSFEHEVWHNGTGLRLILIVDIWHPELTAQEKKNLSAI